MSQGLLWALAFQGPVDTQTVSTGTYVLELHVDTHAKLPFFGWTKSTTNSTVLAVIQKTEEGLIQRHTPCDVQVITRKVPAKTIIPKAMMDSLPIKTYEIDFSKDGKTWRYKADLGEDHIGYDPSITKTVPTQASDPGVIDGDKDGNPGVTVEIDVMMFGTSELYVAQRGHLWVEGTLEEDGSVRGKVDMAPVVQHTMDASNRFMMASPPIRPDPENSWFELRPVSSQTTCKDIQLLIKQRTKR
ncbi:MAG: hypothetical protein ACPGTU_01635 [Myxococcota bacterium]